jgi:hypothetical protein
MAHKVVIEDYIFATNQATPTDVSPINKALKVPPLRSVSTNLAENKEPVYEEITDDYARNKNDTTIAPPSHKYDYLDFVQYNGTADKNEQIKSSFFWNRKKLIILSSILFVVAIVAIIALIMIVLATASKCFGTLHIKFTVHPLSNDKLVFGVVKFNKP